MADISISLSNVKNFKTVNIKELGVFTVRRLGAGEELDLSLKLRRLMNILETINKIDLQKYDLSNAEEKKKYSKDEKLLDNLSDEINEIKQFELRTYKKCFSSTKKGAVDDLIDPLSDEERTSLFNQIFGLNKPIDEPETPELGNE